jgi:hypothetical protein
MSDECAAYSIDDALAFGLAERLHERHGLRLCLYGPEGGLWLADFYLPGPAGHISDGYARAPTRAEAIRLAAERVEEAMGDEKNSTREA